MSNIAPFTYGLGYYNTACSNSNPTCGSMYPATPSETGHTGLLGLMPLSVNQKAMWIQSQRPMSKLPKNQNRTPVVSGSGIGVL